MAERRSTLLLLLGMLVWVGIGFVAALVVAAALGAGAGLLRALLPQDAIAFPEPLTFVLVGAAGFQGVLLLAAWRQGRRAGRGDWRSGVGFAPVRRKPLITLFCALILGWLAAVLGLLSAFPALREFARSVTPQVLLGGMNDSVPAVLARVALIAVLAPLSEELFFRGWLWEALRRRGHAGAMTAGLTALPWLLLHGIDSPWRIVVLIPAAVIFSLARQCGGSVRASLAVHVTNNGAAVLLQFVATLFGHDT